MTTLPPPLDPGTVLLHIGPHKTGTTALQGAFHTCRDGLAAHGVHYAGSGRQPMLAGLAMSGRPGRRGDPAATPRHWQDLVDETKAHRRDRVVISSEFFADVTAETAKKMVAALGGSRVHVVITLRPLGRLMPSQWQQYVQNGLRMRFPNWLDHLLNIPPYDKPNPTFWNRHRHDRLVDRWLGAVSGPDKLTVIVLDESDRDMLLRTFEALVGVPAGVLVPEAGIANRSLSAAEVEVVRRLNEEFFRREWPDAVYGRFIRNAVVKRLLAERRPAPDEPRVVMPAWAAKRAAEIGQGFADHIAATGVNVVGDLASLGELAESADDDEEMPEDPVLPASAAAIALVGTITASSRAAWPGETDLLGAWTDGDVDDRSVDAKTTVDLVRIVVARARRRAGIVLRGRWRR